MTMKTPTFLLVLVAIVGVAGSLRSQLPGAPKSPLQQLQAMKTQNQQLIEKQNATLQKLDELQKTASQIKVLTKRS